MNIDNDSLNNKDFELDSIEEIAIELACLIGFGAASKLTDRFKIVLEQNVSKENLAAIVSKAMCVKNNARDLINKTARENIGQDIDVIDCCKDEEVTRLKEIAAIASAVGTSSQENYQKHIKIAKEAGLTNEEINLITKKSFDIKMQLFWDFKDDIFYPDGSSENKHSSSQGCCSGNDSCETSCKPGDPGHSHSKEDGHDCCK